MNKNIIVVFIAIIVLVGVGILLFSKAPDQAETTPADSDKTISSENTSDMSPKDNSGQYTMYTKNTFDTSVDNRRILFFYASWCPTCRPADADFMKNSKKIPGDVTVLRVNYNDPDTDQEEKDLARKYDVTYQHTFVQIDGQGNEVTKWNGGSLEDLLARLK